jgi:(1->4)-alpha-D-glucan 1-alpha-D-glucosylmutase
MTRLTATCRLQLHAGFTFADAEAQIPYLKSLGVSHVYLSPIAEAHPKSTHFYDQVDPTRISAALGGETRFRRLANACAQAGLGIILDIVPNHMGIGADNPYWMEMLEFGRKAASANLFDIDWSRGRVHLPVLGEPVENCLAREEFSLALEPEGRIVLRYFEHEFPLRPAAAALLLGEAAAACEDERAAALCEEWKTCDAFVPRPEALAQLRERLRRQLDASPAWRAAAQQRLQEAQKPMALALLLESQHWHLAQWQTAATELNYRRFFNIASLAGVRVEDPEVFDLMHRLPLQLAKEKLVQGLRVDHIDGLSDPARYAARLREAAGRDVSVHVEKILAGEEMLPDWPVDGTTGYEMLNLINGVFIAEEGYAALRAHAAEQLGVTGEPTTRVRGAKRQLLTESFAAELKALVDVTVPLGEDVPRAEIEAALVAFIAACPVYRTYLTTAEPDARDGAVNRIVLGEITGAPRAAALLRRLLTGTADAAAAEFRRRLQQLTGPVMAKGYEDTELYRYVVLLSANEVGGSVAQPALSADLFHDRVRARSAWSMTLVPLATHDTKRGADTRARLNVLSECADDWIAASTRWSETNRSVRGRVSAADEAFIYQTLLSCWPADVERVQAAIIKSVREARLKTSWEKPDAVYEKDVTDFVTALLTGKDGEAFRADFAPFVARIVAAGRRNSIAQTVLQLTIPGVPDIYQGTELWDFSLVDPDNRRPVDWELRQRLLTEEPDAWDAASGAGKQALIRRLMALRAELPEVFAVGDYVPVPAPENMLGFARVHASGAVLVLVGTRALATVPEGTVFSPPPPFRGAWTDALSGRSMELGAETRLDLPLPLVLRRDHATDAAQPS